MPNIDEPDAIQLISVSQLVVSPQCQIRARVHPGTVRTYELAMKRGVVFPPIKVARLENIMLLVDGFHRVAAMQRNNLQEAAVEVFDVKSMEEACWLAAAANLRHGLQLKRKERREVFRAYVRAGKHRLPGKQATFKSYREIAVELGGVISYSTAHAWMKEDFRRIWRTMGRLEEGPKGRGGLVATRHPESVLAEDVRDALQQATVAAAGISDPQRRYVLWEMALGLSRSLEEGGIKAPDF